MKTNDVEINMMSSTTKDDAHLLRTKWKWRSQTTPKDKGRQSRGIKRVSHNQTLPSFAGARNCTLIA